MIYTKFVEFLLDFSKIRKGGAKRGGSTLWVLMNIESDLKKAGNFEFFTLEVCRWKGGQKGGREKGVQKGGQRFRTLVPTKYIIIWSSDESFRGHISIFWKNHYGTSNIATCPPFAPPFFQNVIFQKSGASHFTRIKNQLHTHSCSKDTLFQSKKCRILAENDKRGGKIWFSKFKKIADFCNFGLRLQQLDFSF